jgi:hypothetical protein
MIMIQLLSFGALGLGLAVLAFAANLLRLELKNEHPRKEAYPLIFSFMLFSLVAFGTSVYLELQEREIAALYESKGQALAQELDSLKAEQTGVAEIAQDVLPKLRRAAMMASDRGCPGEGSGIPIPHGGDIAGSIGEAVNLLSRLVQSPRTANYHSFSHPAAS